MSYILEALRKADAERERGSVPDLHAQLLPLSVSDAEVEPPRSALGLWLGLGIGLVASAGAAWWLFGRDEPAAHVPPTAAIAAAPLPAPPPAAVANPPTPTPTVPAVAVAPPQVPPAAPPEVPAPRPVAKPKPPAAASSPARAAQVPKPAASLPRAEPPRAAGACAAVGRTACRTEADGSAPGRRRLGLFAAGECAHGGHQRPGVPGRQQPGAGAQAGTGSPEDGRVLDPRPALRAAAVRGSPPSRLQRLKPPARPPPKPPPPKRPPKPPPPKRSPPKPPPPKRSPPKPPPPKPP